mgnify:FL=1
MPFYRDVEQLCFGRHTHTHALTHAESERWGGKEARLLKLGTMSLTSSLEGGAGTVVKELHGL